MSLYISDDSGTRVTSESFCILSTISISSAFCLIMLTAEIRCPGCDKLFRPRGLAQHISKSRDARCHGSGAPLTPQVLAVSFPHTVSRQSAHPFPPLEASGGGGPYDNLDPQLTISEFTATCFTHRILKIFR